MFLDVYLDLYFLINLSMDLICFYILSSVLKIKLPPKRAIIASTVGGIYSCVALIAGITGILSVICDALVCLFMVIIIYIERERKASYYIALSALYIGISMLIGGVMTAIFTFLNRIGLDTDYVSGDSISVFLFAAIALVSAIASLKATKTISRRGSKKKCRIRIKMNEQEKSLFGLVDSGNMVESPLGRGVIFVDRKSVSEMLPNDADKQFLSGKYTPIGAGAISINTASGSSVCVTFNPDAIFISPIDDMGRETQEYESDCLISLTDISCDEYSAIIPESAIRII